MRIVFHGENAASFSHDFGRRVGETADIRILPDLLTSSAHREAYAKAEAIIGVRFARDLPQPENLQLFHVPGAGYDAVDLDALPDSTVVCKPRASHRGICHGGAARKTRTPRRCRPTSA